MKQLKQKTCKSCGEKFAPTTSLQVACSMSCAIDYAREKKARAQRRETREKKREFLANDRRHQLQLAQKAFNQFIRLRDQGKPCISCGRSDLRKVNAGHYRSVGACPALRFEPDNVHLQCEHCNSYLSGNIVEYRINLVKKIGLERVEWLESEHETKKYSVEEIIAIKKKYQQLCMGMSVR